MTNPPTDIDEILGLLAGAVSVCWTPMPTGVFNDELVSRHVEAAKQAIALEIEKQTSELLKIERKLERSQRHEALNKARQLAMVTAIRQYIAACENAKESPSWDNLNAFHAGQLQAYKELRALQQGNKS